MTCDSVHPAATRRLPALPAEQSPARTPCPVPQWTRRRPPKAKAITNGKLVYEDSAAFGAGSSVRVSPHLPPDVRWFAVWVEVLVDGRPNAVRVVKMIALSAKAALTARGSAWAGRALR